MMLAFYKWFTKTFLTCRDAARLVSESCERELSLGEKIKLKALCIMCPYTERYEKQVTLMHEKISDCLEHAGEEASPVGMSAECKERMKAKLAETE